MAVLVFGGVTAVTASATKGRHTLDLVSEETGRPLEVGQAVEMVVAEPFGPEFLGFEVEVRLDGRIGQVGGVVGEISCDDASLLGTVTSNGEKTDTITLTGARGSLSGGLGCVTTPHDDPVSLNSAGFPWTLHLTVGHGTAGKVSLAGMSIERGTCSWTGKRLGGDYGEGGGSLGTALSMVLNPSGDARLRLQTGECADFLIPRAVDLNLESAEGYVRASG